MVKFIIYFFIVIILLQIIFKDIKEKIISNKSNLLLLILGILLGVLENNLYQRFLGSAVYTLPFILIYSYGSDFLNKECMGVGDIKLMMNLGFLLKFQSFYKILLFINISFIIPLLFIFLKYLLTRKISNEIAFGPFLVLSFVLILILEKYGI
ncbi:prepilin peptidase [Cetobacterium somerae]|uniref:prepilin peptidase n=1 Tax=Cetobacterium somerae TaxID=188913 RepID=UPI003D768AE6